MFDRCNLLHKHSQCTQQALCMIKTPHCIILNQLLFPLHGILIFAHFKTVYLHFAQYLAAIKSLKLHKMCHSEIF